VKLPRRGVVFASVAGFVVGAVAMVAPVQFALVTGSNDFCGTGCHSMQPAFESYQRGPHASNAVGVPASCADCHIPYESQHADAIEFVKLLWFKAISGGKDSIAELRGTIATPEKWEAAKPRLRQEVFRFMESNHSLTCRGCHDLGAFAGAGNAMAAEIHAGAIRTQTVNCLECHQGFAHVDAPAPPAPAPTPAVGAAPPSR
jgi:nitrate/TMAO reductase-like tetraheme cytochrome c subunit